MFVTNDVLCWITTVLVCMSRVGWNPSWFPDYRDYGSLSTRIWSLRWLFLYLRSYDLVGSVTPLVLVGAPTQGYSSPLIHARIKCSLRVDSSTLRRGESPTTAHNLELGHPQALRMITELPITTKPSRWWRSPRVTSMNSHLTTRSLMRTMDAHFATLDSLMRLLSWILKSQSPH